MREPSEYSPPDRVGERTENRIERVGLIRRGVAEQRRRAAADILHR